MGRKRQEQVTGKTYEQRVKDAKGFRPFRRIRQAMNWGKGTANNSRDVKNRGRW